MMRNFIIVISIVLLGSCSSETKKHIPIPVKKAIKPAIKLVETPKFNSDSAYHFIQKQVNFGPRVPNLDSHKKCAEYLINKLKSYGCTVITQDTTAISFNNKTLEIQNIIGQFNPDATNRIMLSSHWDSRPFADRDNKKRAKPIEAANDGASGVGVLLEIARIINKNKEQFGKNLGIDFILFDAEDYGQPNGTMQQNNGNTWCLGSQIWSKKPHKKNYQAKFGILLDMVGAKNAVFPKETYSMQFAPQIVNNIWNIAHKMGYSKYFVNQYMQGGITDDHVYVNQYAGVPMVDIIHYEINKNDFFPYHHTHKDNMSIIDTTTLNVVGNTLMQVVYQEKDR